VGKTPPPIKGGSKYPLISLGEKYEKGTEIREKLKEKRKNEQNYM
jgi:hypothetical protein